MEVMHVNYRGTISIIRESSVNAYMSSVALHAISSRCLCLRNQSRKTFIKQKQQSKG
jgi:hypothetical protein